MNGVPAPRARKTSGLAITAFVLACLFILPLLPIIGSILGIIALVRMADRPELGGKGLAIAAIPLGLVVGLFFQGILAAVSIPAFIKYVRKSKTVEAVEGLHRLGAGARAFARAGRYDTSGALLPKAFPDGSTGWQPATPCCSQPGGRCVVDPGWREAPWTTLSFALDTPHHFQWRYQGQGARFTAEARADLDCDGTYSSYRIHGVLTSAGEPEITGPIIENELE